MKPQFETAQFFPLAVRGRFMGELACHGREVVRDDAPLPCDAARAAT